MLINSPCPCCLVPGLVPFSSSGELVGRLPTVFANPGTEFSKSRGKGKRKQDENRRTVRLRLLPSGSQERRLRRIADATAKLWNELNYASCSV